MKTKSKFLWIYSFTLFAIAFILILFAAFTASDYQNQLSENIALYQGAQSSISNLQEENKALNNKLEEINREFEDYKAKVNEDSLILKEQELQNYINATESIFKANDLFYKGLYDECKELLDSVDLEILNEEAKAYHQRLYNDLNIAFKNKAKKK